MIVPLLVIAVLPLEGALAHEGAHHLGMIARVGMFLMAVLLLGVHLLEAGVLLFLGVHLLAIQMGR